MAASAMVPAGRRAVSLASSSFTLSTNGAAVSCLGVAALPDAWTWPVAIA
jgi:hypothetical protein